MPTVPAPAVNAALNEGATLILGPLLSAEVQAISPIARQRNVPVIAFSSVAGVAGNGVYLMSFLPGEEVSNLVRYAAKQGIRNIAAMVPQSAYGSTAENALNQAVAANGARVVALDRYPRSSAGVASTSRAVAGKIANSTNDIQGLFLPEGGAMLANAGNGLSAAGVSSGKVRMLGNRPVGRALHVQCPAGQRRLVCRCFAQPDRAVLATLSTGLRQHASQNCQPGL